MPKKKSHEEFIAQLFQVNPSIIPLGTYINAQSHILCRCTICNHQWQALPGNLLKGEGCQQCACNRKYTQEEFISKVSKTNPNVSVIGNYINSKTRVEILCHVCGKQNAALPVLLYKGQGCPTCGRTKAAQSKVIPKEQFISKLSCIRPDMELISAYTGMSKPASFKCKYCGNVITTTPGNLLSRKHCGQCYSMVPRPSQLAHYPFPHPNMKSHETFVKEVHEINPDIIILGQYQGADKKVLCKCTVCNHEWQTRPTQIFRGQGCPNCRKRWQTSFPEQALLYYLTQVFPDATNTYKDGFGQSELDIFIPSLSIGIEYDGRAWHRNKKRLEAEKYAICKQKSIRLIRIRERPEPDDVGCICDDVILSRYGDTKSYNDLDSCIRQLFSLLHADIYHIDINTSNHHSNIEANYYNIISEKSLGALFPEIASEWYQPRNGAITPFMLLPRSNASYYWKCKDCGYIYPSVVSNRTAGHGCPKCAGQLRRTAEQFADEIGTINPDIEVISSFQNTDSKITIRCKKCGAIDVLNARSLLNGAGCKQCNYTKLHNDRVMSSAEFINRVHGINPDIEISGEYINAAKRIACRCRKCGYSWKPVAGSILYQSTGCPRCAGIAKKRVLCVDTGIEYDSITKAEKSTGISHVLISRCCNGKAFSAGGFHWKFL